jgi:PAS domain S-box-containing protein
MSASHETDFVNSRMAEMMGYAVEEMLGRPVEFFMFEEDLADHAGKMENRHAGGNDRYERRFRRKDGSELWTIVSATALVGEDGGFMGSFAMFTDITDRKLSEIRVRESLREKEVLLKEIHHRVKNNLQMIVSLLNIQKQRIDSRELAEELSVLQNRVTAIAHIHEALYGSESFSKIRFDDYARSILHDLSYVYAATSRGIHVREELSPVDLTIEQAIPCGLILNELLTNSFKHAFADTGNDGKTVALAMSRDGDVVTLAVSDNGVGMPEKGDNVLKHVSGLDIVDCAAQADTRNAGHIG